MNDENINKKLLEDLKNLPEVNAPKNFETELFRKINSTGKKQKKSFWKNLLTPPKLVPAAVVLASTIIIFFVVDGNSEVMEDPLNIEPRLREDIYITETMDDIILQNEDEEISKKPKKEQNTIRRESVKENFKDKTAKGEEKNTEEVLGTNRGIIPEVSYNEKTTSDSIQSNKVQKLEENLIQTPVNVSSQEVSKKNLNFMQRSLSTKEKQEVQLLKMKAEGQKEAGNEQKSEKMP
ncbi:MAG: hypothetical protein ROY99_02045 [Ignavibacterium sp.]|jgi:hypothetical protein|nr:hypothetical protein [Ignavibacterium sp.]